MKTSLIWQCSWCWRSAVNTSLSTCLPCTLWQAAYSSSFYISFEKWLPDHPSWSDMLLHVNLTLFFFLSGNLFSFLLWLLALSFYSTSFSAFFLGASSFSACLVLAFYKLTHTKHLASTDPCGIPACFCTQLSWLSPCIAPSMSWASLFREGTDYPTIFHEKNPLCSLVPQLPK